MLSSVTSLNRRPRRSQWFLGELRPIADFLREIQPLPQELQSSSFAEKDAEALDSYLIKIRHDGVGAHANVRQRLDAVAENNTAIVTLIKAYRPQSKTTGFTLEADKFHHYASA